MCAANATSCALCAGATARSSSVTRDVYIMYIESLLLSMHSPKTQSHQSVRGLSSPPPPTVQLGRGPCCAPRRPWSGASMRLAQQRLVSMASIFLPIQVITPNKLHQLICGPMRRDIGGGAHLPRTAVCATSCVSCKSVSELWAVQEERRGDAMACKLFWTVPKTILYSWSKQLHCQTTLSRMRCGDPLGPRQPPPHRPCVRL